MGETDCGGNAFVLMGEAMLSKSSIQFSVDGRGCVPSLFDDRLVPNWERSTSRLYIVTLLI